MPFTGKATYSAGAALPEIAEDVSDIIGLVSPFETPLLDHLGDPQRSATSTIHEWLEDSLLPNTDSVNDAIDLAERLAKSTRVRQSIIRHAFRYFLGRNEMLSDSKTLIDAEQAYLDSDGSFDAVIVSLLTSDSFIHRKVTEN